MTFKLETQPASSMAKPAWRKKTIMPKERRKKASMLSRETEPSGSVQLKLMAAVAEGQPDQEERRKRGGVATAGAGGQLPWEKRERGQSRTRDVFQ